jgi:hypothetical protein
LTRFPAPGIFRAPTDLTRFPKAMPVPLLDLRAQHGTIRDSVVDALMRVVDDQAFILGEPVQQLEASVAALSNTKYAVGCANGTDALLLAMRALDIGRGDEVVTTPFTFFATAGTIHNVGATPVFVDIDPATFNVRADAVAAAVNSRTRTPRRASAPAGRSTARGGWPARRRRSARTASSRPRTSAVTGTAG